MTVLASLGELAPLAGALSLILSLTVALAIRNLPSVKLQLGLLALASAAIPIGAVFASGEVMLGMGGGPYLAEIAVLSALGAILGALMVQRGVVRRISMVQKASQDLAAGDLAARAPRGGPSELAQLAEAFNYMASSVERTFDARRELIAWASHDLRAPIASIRAMVEAVADGVADADLYKEALLSQVSVLSRLVDDIFDLACIDAGAIQPDIRECDLTEVIVDCIARFRIEAEIRDLEVRIGGDGAPGKVMSDPVLIDRVLSNLVSNSLRFAPQGGWISVEHTSAGETVRVAVEDSGGGIRISDTERAFTPFWKEDVARSSDSETEPSGSGSLSSGGAGLGLAISKGLVESLGGRIWAERSAPDRTRIVFELGSAEALARASST